MITPVVRDGTRVARPTHGQTRGLAKTNRQDLRKSAITRNGLTARSDLERPPRHHPRPALCAGVSYGPV